MHVSKQFHLRIVLILGILIACLLVLLTLSYLEINSLKYQRENSPALGPIVATGTQEIGAPPSPYLEAQEVFIVESDDEAHNEIMLPVEKPLFEYVEVVESCGPHFEGECVNVRSGPGIEYPVVTRLRTGVVLKVGGFVERDGELWFKIVFDEWLRYPERITSDWYVASDFVEILLNEGDKTLSETDKPTSTKRIVVNRTTQKLTAYDGDDLFMEIPISTGLELTPTPRGTFTVFKKTPSRYMQGPIPGVAEQYYDVPGVPWNLYFTHGGAVIHGTYWHNSFGSTYSHGCVNLSPEDAERLYHWADLGTKVTVLD